ncbi:putative reverse transcriptase domain-containing protein [Tanacetum coccineum]
MLWGHVYLGVGIVEWWCWLLVSGCYGVDTIVGLLGLWVGEVVWSFFGVGGGMVIQLRSVRPDGSSSQSCEQRSRSAFTTAVAQEVADLLPTLYSSITSRFAKMRIMGITLIVGILDVNTKLSAQLPAVEHKTGVEHIEKIFEVLGCDDQFKARLANISAGMEVCCYTVGGHLAKDCGKNRGVSNTGNGNNRQHTTRGRVSALTTNQAANVPGTVSGTLYMYDRDVFVLFDTGATHSVVSLAFSKHIKVPSTLLDYALSISTPMKNNVVIGHEFRDCPLRLDLNIRLLICSFRMSDFELFLCYGLPPEREVEFTFELDSCAQPISKAPSEWHQLIQGN